jgi:uncharacterized protein DUF4402
MGGFRPLVLTFAALAAAAAGAWPASGQCRLCDTPSTALTQSQSDSGIELHVETSIDFGRMILSGPGQGAAVIRPDGSNAAEGSLAGVSARAMVGSASVHGEAGRAVRVELPQRIELYSIDGGRMTFDDVVSDLPTLPRLDSAGNLSFRFGGRLTVTGDSEGQYRGDLPINVEYQ